jgi:hypothetical protein
MGFGFVLELDGLDLLASSASAVDELSSVAGPHASPETHLAGTFSLGDSARVMHIFTSEPKVHVVALGKTYKITGDRGDGQGEKSLAKSRDPVIFCTTDNARFADTKQVRGRRGRA